MGRWREGSVFADARWDRSCAVDCIPRPCHPLRTFFLSPLTTAGTPSSPKSVLTGENRRQAHVKAEASRAYPVDGPHRPRLTFRPIMHPNLLSSADLHRMWPPIAARFVRYRDNVTINMIGLRGRLARVARQPQGDDEPPLCVHSAHCRALLLRQRPPSSPYADHRAHPCSTGT